MGGPDPSREVTGTVAAMALYAGQGIGQVTRVVPAGHVVTELAQERSDCLGAGAAPPRPGSGGWPPSSTAWSVHQREAVALGLQNATVRRLAVADVTTTVLTLTLTGLAADSWLAGGRSPRVGRRVAAVGLMAAGALRADQ